MEFPRFNTTVSLFVVIPVVIGDPGNTIEPRLTINGKIPLEEITRRIGVFIQRVDTDSHCTFRISALF